jgi:hypothetical protein
MPRLLGRRHVVAVSLLVALLSGCAPTSVTDAGDTPAPTSTSSVTASPTPTAVVPASVIAVTVSGASLSSIDATGAVVETVPFTGGAESLVPVLTEVSGVAPEVSEVAESCSAAFTSYAWGDTRLLDFAGGDDFVVIVDGSSLGGVRIQTVGGYAVGDDMTQFVSTLPEEDLGRFDDSGRSLFVSFDTVERDSIYNTPAGAVGLVDLGALTSVISPGDWGSFLC